MSGLVIFSDIHFVPQFVDEQIKVVTDIFNFAREHKADAVIHNGDLFEAKNRIDVALYNAVWKLFYDFSVLTPDVPLVLNTGNHDIIALNRESSLKPFSRAVSFLVTAPTTKLFDTYAVTIVPYGMSIPYSKPSEILFTHELIDVFLTTPVKGNILKAEDVSDYFLVFNGHIHSAADKGNIYNIGSSFRTDFGEEGQDKRFLYLDNGRVYSLPIDCPQYITLDGISDVLVKKLEKDDRNIFRINISPDQLNHPIFKKHNVKPNVIKAVKSETRLEKTSSIEEEIEAYLKQSKTNLDNSRLLQLGLNILNKTRGL